MKDWKLVAGLVIGSAVLVLIMIFGLSKMGGVGAPGLKVDETELMNGVRFTKGDSNAKVRVVVFSDMECPACKRADAMLKRVASLPGVSFSLRHFPLTIHTHSKNGARAAEAAWVMGKGWEMVDALFEKQAEWSSAKDVDAQLIEMAGSLGLNKDDFKIKMASAEVTANINLDSSLADKFLLNGTPTVYVNGEQVAVDFVEGKVKELLGVK